MSEKLNRTIHPEVRVISEADGLVDYIASDETLDCYDEVISAKGWRFNRFSKNAPFVDSHQYESIKDQLGIVTSAKIVGKQLVERVKWAKDVQENALAQLGWKMTLGGFLKAVSVGFFPIRSIRQGDADWAKTVNEMGIADIAPNVRRIFLEQDQIELSACIIGANPNALAKAHKDGCVKDADLAACGFADEDMTFLHAASKVMEQENTEEITRLLIAREMRRITGRQKTFKGDPSPAPASPANTPDGAEQAERLAAERKAFLESLTRVAG
jgi:hypothetical protein